MSSCVRAIRSASPAFEPVSLAEAKKHLELASDDPTHDQHVRDLIKAARELVEHDCQVALASGTWTLTLDDFDAGEDEIEIPIRPVTSITSITYVDSAGTTQTWSSAEYALDNNEAMPQVRLAYLQAWPNARGEPNSVTITFVAGFSSQAAVEQKYKQAMLLQIARMFEDRTGAEKLPEDNAYDRLANRFARPTYP